mgnify:FL=1
MEINKIDNGINLNNEIQIREEQTNFLETTLGKTINTAIDIGIRALLPDFIDEQIINIKDNLLNYGLKDGISKTIEDAIDIGKSAIGIFTGNFESVSQMQNAIETGGLIDGISSLLDTVVDKVNKKGIINYNIANTIKQGKDIILNSVEHNIEEKFKEQNVEIENIEKYMNNWKENFSNKNFEKMEKEYNKIEKILETLAPLEEIINQARIIENIHNLIKNNGQNFNLNQEQLALAEKLI